MKSIKSILLLLNISLLNVGTTYATDNVELNSKNFNSKLNLTKFELEQIKKRITKETVFSSNGGVIGDGGTFVTLSDGSQVPADFFLDFNNQILPETSEHINLKNDYPEVFVEYQKIQRMVDQRAGFLGEKSFFGKDIALDKLTIVKTDNLNCHDLTEVELGDISIAGCAYMFNSFNADEFSYELLKVIELDKEVMDSSSISARNKALLLTHEVLHHIFSKAKSGRPQFDEHRIISPLIKYLAKAMSIQERQEALYKEANELYHLSSAEVKDLQILQKILKSVKVLAYNSDWTAGDSLSDILSRPEELYVHPNGGGLVNEKAKIDSTNYIDMNSHVLVKYAVFKNSTVINSSINSTRPVAVNVNSSTIENSKLLSFGTKMVIQDSSVLGSVFFTGRHIHILNSAVSNSKFETALDIKKGCNFYRENTELTGYKNKYCKRSY